MTKYRKGPTKDRKGPQRSTTHGTTEDRQYHKGPQRTTVENYTGARFTKYLTTILRLSYDNAIVTIDLRWTTKIYHTVLRRVQGFS